MVYANLMSYPWYDFVIPPPEADCPESFFGNPESIRDRHAGVTEKETACGGHYV